MPVSCPDNACLARMLFFRLARLTGAQPRLPGLLQTWSPRPTGPPDFPSFLRGFSGGCHHAHLFCHRHAQEESRHARQPPPPPSRRPPPSLNSFERDGKACPPLFFTPHRYRQVILATDHQEGHRAACHAQLLPPAPSFHPPVVFLLLHLSPASEWIGFFFTVISACLACQRIFHHTFSQYHQ